MEDFCNTDVIYWAIIYMGFLKCLCGKEKGGRELLNRLMAVAA